MSNHNQPQANASAIMDSPIGKLTILADGKGITEIRFPNKTERFFTKNDKPNWIIEKTIEQLDAYFGGRLKAFDLPLNVDGTDFQRGVWAQLQKISYGATASYRDVALAIGNPKASRAVGMANNKNKIPIVIPCHRIIGSDGSLTGFAGGLDTKRWLLNHEKS